MRGPTRYRVPMRETLVPAALLASLALATPVAAGEPTETLRRLFASANQILAASEVTDDARRTALRALVREAFDAREAAALALGRDWTTRTVAERDEFSRLYADVFESAYLGGVGSRARLHADGIRIAFGSESVQGTTATVVTTLEKRGGGAMPVEYRLSRGERGWAVVDVLVDGLSLAGSYRAQIQRVMQSGTYADLVARLREKASTTTLAAISPVPVPAASVAAVSDTAPAPVPSPRTSFWLQVGAFRDTEAASRMVERLRSHSVIVATGGGPSDVLARVLVGPFAARAAAASALRDLSADGYRPFIAVE
jgi:phospholipid transport system substrate-binding protein